MKPTAIRFDVRVQGGEIIVTLADFCAIYVNPSSTPHLILKRRTETADHETLSRAYDAPRRGTNAPLSKPYFARQCFDTEVSNFAPSGRSGVGGTQSSQLPLLE